MKYALLFLLSTLELFIVHAQRAEGDWKGVLHVSGTELPIIFHFQKDEAGKLTGTWDSPKQNANGLQFSSVVTTPDSLIVKIDFIAGKYSGRYVGKDSMQGVWEQGGIRLPLSFSRTEGNEVKKTEENAKGNLFIKMRDGVEIFGNAYLHDKSAPLVIMVAGSGPTGLDGNSSMDLSTNSYLYLAKGLDSDGISSFRYDKRTIGRSVVPGLKEKELTFEMFGNDVADIVSHFRAEGYQKIFIAGHSEGSLLGILAGEQVPVSGFISIAGVGTPAGEVLQWQLAKNMPSQKEESKRIIADLEAGKEVSNVPAELASIFRSSVQPYLISWFKYNPKKEIKKLKCPVLILQGTCDIQVDTTQALDLKKALPAARLVMIKDMSHTLKDAGANCKNQQAAYTDASLPVEEKLVKEITDFVTKN